MGKLDESISGKGSDNACLGTERNLQRRQSQCEHQHAIPDVLLH